MAKKKANSFVLTIAGIAAATVIGVVGVNLTPAPHVIFSLAPNAEPQATAEPEPIGCVLAGTGQVVDFANPGAEEYVSLLDTDSQSLTERYALPALERMTQSDTESLIAPLQVIQRIQTLGIDPGGQLEKPVQLCHNPAGPPGHRRNRPGCEFYRFQPGRTE